MTNQWNICEIAGRKERNRFYANKYSNYACLNAGLPDGMDKWIPGTFLRRNYFMECFFRSVTTFFLQKFQNFFPKNIFFRLLKMYTRAILSNTRRVAAQQSVRNAVSFQLLIYGISTLHFLKIQFILGNSNRRGML